MVRRMKRNLIETTRGKKLRIMGSFFRLKAWSEGKKKRLKGKPACQTCGEEGLSIQI